MYIYILGNVEDCYIVGGTVCGDSIVTLARIGIIYYTINIHIFHPYIYLYIHNSTMFKFYYILLSVVVYNIAFDDIYHK